MADGENVVRHVLKSKASVPIAYVPKAMKREATFLRASALVLLAVLLLAILVACSKPPEPEAAEAPQATGLERIPLADPSKYPAISNMVEWRNPYLVVREDGIGFVDLSNREIHILKPEEIPAELVALSSDAWPYGRVVLVTEAMPKDASDQTKADIRKNRALLMGTLKELDVQFREPPRSPDLSRPN
jgi:hypothetical protein